MHGHGPGVILYVLQFFLPWTDRRGTWRITLRKKRYGEILESLVVKNQIATVKL